MEFSRKGRFYVLETRYLIGTPTGANHKETTRKALAWEHVGFNYRAGDYTSHIVIKPLKEWPTKCELCNGKKKILSFNISKSQDTYPFPTIIGLDPFGMYNLRFDSEVQFTVHFGWFPQKDRPTMIYLPIAVYFGVWQIYENGYLRFSNTLER